MKLSKYIELLLNHLRKQSKFSLLVRSYLTVFIIFLIDYFTGPHLSLLVCYLFPIMIVTWYIGTRAGIIISMYSSALTLVHGILYTQIFSSGLIPSWNFIANGIIFIIISLTLSAIKAAEEEKLSFEFKVARDVQKSLLPRFTPPMKTLNYIGGCKTTNHVSGDYHDFFLLEPNKLAIAVGDICGKGISAALLMANLQGLLRSYAPMCRYDVVELMSYLNKAMCSSTGEDKFATLFYSIYDDLNRTFTFVNAGHNPPVVFRRRSENMPIEIHRIETNNTVIGAFPECVYTSGSFRFLPGDIIIMFTDGVPESRNYLKKEYGEDRLIELISMNQHLAAADLHLLILNDIEIFMSVLLNTCEERILSLSYILWFIRFSSQPLPFFLRVYQRILSDSAHLFHAAKIEGKTFPVYSYVATTAAAFRSAIL